MVFVGHGPEVPGQRRATSLVRLRSAIESSPALGALASELAEEIRGFYSQREIEVTEADLERDDLRTAAVAQAASKVAAIPEVREALVAFQRAFATRSGGAVLDGRDIGTVVFPDALVKIYLTARPEIRATRRANDAEAASKTLEEIGIELEARDHADSTRSISASSPGSAAFRGLPGWMIAT